MNKTFGDIMGIMGTIIYILLIYFWIFTDNFNGLSNRDITMGGIVILYCFYIDLLSKTNKKS